MKQSKKTSDDWYPFKGKWDMDDYVAHYPPCTDCKYGYTGMEKSCNVLKCKRIGIVPDDIHFNEQKFDYQNNREGRKICPLFETTWKNGVNERTKQMMEEEKKAVAETSAMINEMIRKGLLQL